MITDTNIVLTAFGVTAFWGLLVWSLIWKGLALWRAAKMGHKVWFVMILVLNTIGILEIFYIFVFSRKSESKKEKSVEKPRLSKKNKVRKEALPRTGRGKKEKPKTKNKKIKIKKKTPVK